MARRKKTGCVKCGRRLKNPHPSGMGPVCRRKGLLTQIGLGGTHQAPVAEGQLSIFPEVVA